MIDREHERCIDRPDEWEPLAYAYEDGSLDAVLYNRKAVQLAEGFGPWTVSRTPGGERYLSMEIGDE